MIYKETSKITLEIEEVLEELRLNKLDKEMINKIKLEFSQVKPSSTNKYEIVSNNSIRLTGNVINHLKKQ